MSIYQIIFYRHTRREKEKCWWGRESVGNKLRGGPRNERHINHNDDIHSLSAWCRSCLLDDDDSMLNLLLWDIYGDMVIQRIIGLWNRMLTVRLCLRLCRFAKQWRKRRFSLLTTLGPWKCIIFIYPTTEPPSLDSIENATKFNDASIRAHEKENKHHQLVARFTVCITANAPSSESSQQLRKLQQGSTKAS